VAVFLKRALRREFVTAGGRKYLSEELHNLRSSLNISTAVKSKRKQLAGYVARIREMIEKFCQKSRREETALET
jgi:hypothetical protein